MRPPRWKPLITKSIAAMSAAIEIYNKPVIAHREETFAILSCAAWELLLKARLVQVNGNKLEFIFEKEAMVRRDGRPSVRSRIKRNAVGNPVTVGLNEVVGRTQALPEGPLDRLCAHNIKLLQEVRNNAVHFVNDDAVLGETVHGLAAAAVSNYVRALADWFDEGLSAHRFAILPLSFEPPVGGQIAPGARRSQMVEALQRHIEAATALDPAVDGRFAVALRIETRMVGARQRDAIPIRQGRGQGVAQIALNDEMLLDRYPLSYNDICTRLRERMPDLKINRQFHALRRSLLANPALVHERRLQPNNPRSPKTKFYSEGMVDAMLARFNGEQN